jgi:beta-lactamase class A
MQATTSQALAYKLNELAEPHSFHVGWYLKELRSGFSADRNGDVVVPSASTRKISILMAALKAVNDGRFHLDQPVVMEAKYQNNTSGTFQHLKPGFTITFFDALVMMIIVSDNTCTATVFDMVGRDDIQALCDSIGMTGTTHRQNMPPPNLDRSFSVEAVNATTPNDVGLLLDLILQGTTDRDAATRLGCTPELCQMAIDILSWQKLNNRIPFMLPENTKVAHKTGSVAGQYHDAGIVFQNDRPLFILCAYNSNVPAELPDGTPGFTTANLLIARMARAAWDALRE